MRRQEGSRRWPHAAVVAVLALGALALPGVARAHEEPPGCTTSAVNVSFAPSSGLSTIHRNGDQLEIAVRVSNDAAGACSVDGATVSVIPPQPDGTPGAPITVAENASFPAGMAQTTLSTTVPHTVAFDAATFRGPMTVAQEGTWHGPGGDITLGGSLSTPLVISKPHTTVTVTPSAPSGPVPLAVDYQYTVENDTPVDPDAPTTTPALVGPLSDHDSILDDDTCASPSFVSGDTTVTSPPLLQEGETWVFTCSHVFAGPGTFTNRASALGFSTRDGRPWPATTATSTVTALGSDLRVFKSHSGGFVRGGTGAYALSVANAGNAPSSGTVTLRDQLPAGLSATGISGAGWSCALATLTCTRGDALAGGAAYPPVTVAVNVAFEAPDQVTNVASIAGATGPTGNDSASDPTAIADAGNDFTLGKPRRDGRTVLIDVTVPGPGELVGDDATAATPSAAVRRVARVMNAIKAARASASAAGTVTLRLSPTKSARRKLRSKRKVTAQAAISFDPAGGELATQSAVIKFKRKRR